MRYSHLTDQQIFQAISDSHEAIAALVRYQNHLATGRGLPKDDAARIELMTANIRLVQRIKDDIAELEKELDRRG